MAMRITSWLLFLLLLVGLAGCGGGGSSGSSQNVQVTVSPTTVTLAPGSSRTFAATVTGTSNTQVTWTASGGTINNGGYTAPATAGTYTVRATSVADTSKFAEATVTVTSGGPSVTVSPETATIEPGGNRTFTATVTGLSNTAVTWTAEAGTITAGGVYTAPDTEGTYTVTATSQANPSIKGTATVTVATDPVGVTINPLAAVLGTRESTTFTASVANASNRQVTWSATGGTVTATGVYTAPDDPGSYEVIATSVADPSKSARARVTVSAISVTINPTTVTLVRGTSFDFRAGVTGAQNTALTWTASGGTITATGRYTAPTTTGTYTVTARSVADPRRFVTATVTVVDPTLVTYDFEAGVSGAWSNRTNETAPNGQKFLGRLSGSGNTVLTLSDLTAHRQLKVTFDLYVIGDWRNENVNVSVDGTAAFSRGFSNVEGVTQSYPDNENHAPGTGRTGANLLGYPFAGTILYRDTVYRITFTVNHTSTSAQIQFAAALTKAIENQSWGIDNVTIEAIP